MSIQHIIVHEIRRVKEEKKSTETLIAKIKDTENDLRSLNGELAAKLLKLFSSSSLMVGQFSIGNDTEKKPAFEQGLDNFYSGENCLDFVEMTRELAEYLNLFLLKIKVLLVVFLFFLSLKVMNIPS